MQPTQAGRVHRRRCNNAAHPGSVCYAHGGSRPTCSARLGEFIKPNWQNTHAAFVKLGTLKGTEAPADSYTEQFIAACNDFDRAAIVAQAKGMKP
jgi:hypothetical protein